MQIYLLQELFGGGKCGNGGGLRLGASGGIDTDSDITKSKLDESLNMVNIINKYPKKGVKSVTIPIVSNLIFIQNIIYNIKFIYDNLINYHKFNDNKTLKTIYSNIII